MILTTVTAPVITPIPKITSAGKQEKSMDNRLFTPLITGIYIPKIRSIVDPEIPGRNMADIAIIPIKKSFSISGKEMLPRFTELIPILPFNQVIITTKNIPIQRNKNPFSGLRKDLSSSRTTTGMLLSFFSSNQIPDCGSNR